MQRLTGRVAANLSAASRDSVEAGSLAAKDVLVDFQRRATGGDQRLSGVGRRGAKIGIRFDVKGGRANRFSSLVRATGPAHLIEKRIRPHLITPRRSGGRRNLNRAARTVGGRAQLNSVLGDATGLGAGTTRPLLIPGVGFRAWARHPGIPASAQPKPFEKGLKVARPKAVDAMQKANVEAFRRALRR